MGGCHLTPHDSHLPCPTWAAMPQSIARSNSMLGQVRLGALRRPCLTDAGMRQLGRHGRPCLSRYQEVTVCYVRCPEAAMPNGRWNAVARQTRAAMPESIARSITLCWVRLGLGTLWRPCLTDAGMWQLGRHISVNCKQQQWRICYHLVERLLLFSGRFVVKHCQNSGSFVTIQWRDCCYLVEDSFLFSG